uniref:Ski_Sno domain-containing protein n=1 Tax=Heligmosomoides polygyrus TaxID=6339 RepID=A0A183F473_HELPZ
LQKPVPSPLLFVQSIHPRQFHPDCLISLSQVRALRSKNAIQPGVNRCKLIAATDFDRLYDDCTNTWQTQTSWDTYILHLKWESSMECSSDPQQCNNETDFGAAPCATTINPMFLGQFLPHFSAQQLLVQHMMVPTTTMGISADADVEGTPLNLSKSNSNSETSDNDSLDNMRKEGDISPNQSISERGGSNGSNNSSSSDPSSAAATKIISLIDMASEHFKQSMESIRKERGEPRTRWMTAVFFTQNSELLPPGILDKYAEADSMSRSNSSPRRKGRMKTSRFGGHHDIEGGQMASKG